MTPTAIAQLQRQLGVPATGVFDETTSMAMNKAVAASLSKNSDALAHSSSSPEEIANAYVTGDWSGVTDLTGKPFTDAQQKAAVAQSQAALAPAFDAQKTYETANTTDALAGDAAALAASEKADARQFGLDKNTLDQNAADQGVLFSGSRIQKQNDLRTTYADREAAARAAAAKNITSTARDYQYAYGNGAADKLSSLYSLPGASTFNAGVAGGKVTPSRTLSAAYDPNAYNFQGTTAVAQKAAIQQRAAGLLGNRSNKLSLSGYATKL